MRTRYTDGALIGMGFWPWLAALVLGVLLGLWLAGGDRDPSAAEDVFAATYAVSRMDTHDFRSVSFYAFERPNDGRAVLSIDNDLALARYLARHRGERMDVTLTPHVVQRIER